MSHPNSRAERGALARKLHGRINHREHSFRRFGIEKDWKKIYWRKNKLHRARKIGKIWPHNEWEKVMADAEPVRVLFVCSKNQWRSPTGKAVFRRVEGVDTRSAGTARSARRQLSIADIRWADIILVMEDKHAARIRADFRNETRYKPLHVLDIPDEYGFMDEELGELIRAKAQPLIFNKE